MLKLYKCWSPLLRVSVAGMLMLTTVSAMGYRSVQASSGENSFSAPNRQVDRDAPMTNQIILKYRDAVNLSGANSPNGTNKINALSTAAGETLAYERAMSGGAHVLRLPSKVPLAA